MATSYSWGDRLPTLPAERVTLRWLTAADLPDLYAVFSNEEVNRYWDGARMRSMSDATAYLHDIEEQFRRRALFQWGVADAAGQILGTCTLLNHSVRHRRAEIGYAIGREHWGKGLATEAVVALIRFSFEQLLLHRIEADADPRNDRSVRLLERLGFRREGLLRERYHANGELQDAVFLGLLRTEWDHLTIK